MTARCSMRTPCLACSGSLRLSPAGEPVCWSNRHGAGGWSRPPAVSAGGRGYTRATIRGRPREDWRERGAVRRVLAARDASPGSDAPGHRRRRERARDFNYFGAGVFSHYCLVGGDSRLHEWLDVELPRMADAPEGVRLVMRPRGEAKSTFVRCFRAVGRALTGRKHYILII